MSNSSTTIELEEGPAELPPHPGEVLREEFLGDYALDAPGLARALNLPAADVRRLLEETAPVTPELALRLGRAFSQTAQFWMNLQVRYDLAVVERAAANDLARVLPIQAA